MVVETLSSGVTAQGQPSLASVFYLALMATPILWSPAGAWTIDLILPWTLFSWSSQASLDPGDLSLS